MIKQFAIENTRVFIKNKILNLCGIIYLALSMLLTFTLVSYSPDNPSLNTAISSNFISELSLIFITSDILVQFLGLASYLFPLYFLIFGMRLIKTIEINKPIKKLFLLILLASIMSTALNYYNLNYSVIGNIFSSLLMLIAKMKFSKAVIGITFGVVICLTLFYVFEINLKTIKIDNVTSTLNTFKQIFTRNTVANDFNEHSVEVLENRKKFKKKLISQIHSSITNRKKQISDSSIYMLPPLELLKAPNQSEMKISKNYFSEKSTLLIKTLNDFGITGKITDVSMGPVVTLFQFEPSAGIKAARIISLSNDIARSMSAQSVRVAIISGKSAIGIEIPNDKRETVYLRELLSTNEFEKFPTPLAIALGKSIDGNSVIVDLAQMPHLLVAGTTGSGKSVAINTMILSLLYRLSPDSCKLILIDPKMLELSMYEGIPHLLTPVVTESKKAINILKWAVREMERRYQIMAKVGVRNIYGYNEKINIAIKSGQPAYREVQVGFGEDGKPVIEKEYIENELFPNIVIVVDEMADLMLVAGKEIESAVQRLAQMARAAGIHLIMATQRPSVDVITGTIKANFPTRISFHVSSKIDSRTILGEQGAEHLLGMGDMLYMANASSITRVHGPFVSESEIEAIVKYLKTQGEPKYIENIYNDENEVLQGTDLEEDLMYNEALELMRREGKISTSFIQRHLKIGYNRAARIVDQMQAKGIISEPDHVGRRRIVG